MGLGIIKHPVGEYAPQRLVIAWIAYGLYGWHRLFVLTAAIIATVTIILYVTDEIILPIFYCFCSSDISGY